MKIFILIFCCLIAAAAFWYGIKLLRLYLKVKSWPRVKARILKKEIASKKLSNATRANKIIITEYSFDFNNSTHTGNKTFLVEFLKGEKSFYPDDAERVLKNIGAETEVYVNPNAPGESVMFCDGATLYVVVLLMGALSLLIGLINFIY